jgi:hypothetical protein
VRTASYGKEIEKTRTPKGSEGIEEIVKKLYIRMVITPTTSDTKVYVHDHKEVIAVIFSTHLALELPHHHVVPPHNASMDVAERFAAAPQALDST